MGWHEGFTLPNPGQASSRSGEPRPRGLHSLSRLATTGTVGPGAGCTVEARRGGPLLARRARRPTARSKPWGMRRRRVRRSCGRRVHPSPQADAFDSHNVVVGTVRWGQEGWRWHVLASASCRYSTGSGPVPAVRYCGRTTELDHLPYVYLGNHLARCCYVSICSPACPSSSWFRTFSAEVGPVNSTQNFQKFGAIWSKIREVACLQSVPRT